MIHEPADPWLGRSQRPEGREVYGNPGEAVGGTPVLSRRGASGSGQERWGALATRVPQWSTRCWRLCGQVGVAEPNYLVVLEPQPVGLCGSNGAMWRLLSLMQ